MASPASTAPVVITDITAIAVSFPRPNLGDEFVCTGQSGGLIRAAVISVEGGDQDWTVTLYTKRGHDTTVTGNRERKDQRSWRPPEWVWDPVCATFKPPGTEWNPKARCFMKRGEKLPTSEEMPEPMVGETRNAWRARAKQEFPILLDHVEAEANLTASWAEFEARLAAARAGVGAPSKANRGAPTGADLVESR